MLCTVLPSLYPIYDPVPIVCTLTCSRFFRRSKEGIVVVCCCAFVDRYSLQLLVIVYIVTPASSDKIFAFL